MFGFLKKKSPPPAQPQQPEVPQGPWPLRFDRFAFDARCYNTLACSVLFNNHQHSLYVNEASGPPYAPDWKKDWHAGYNMDRDIVTQGFPPPVQVKWTALDGVERRTEIDLEAIFPNREILHNVPRDEVWELWPHNKYSRMAEIFLEINDRTINVYMKALVKTRHLKKTDEPIQRVGKRELILVWTKTW